MIYIFFSIGILIGMTIGVIVMQLLTMPKKIKNIEV